MASHELGKIARNLDRKLNELQKSVIEIRMVPVGQIYSKLSRTVRKLARELNKEIELVLRGEDTELDKMMVEELTDPLMHIIRNALDHGIESRGRAARSREEPGRPRDAERVSAGQLGRPRRHRRRPRHRSGEDPPRGHRARADRREGSRSTSSARTSCCSRPASRPPPR